MTSQLNNYNYKFINKQTNRRKKMAMFINYLIRKSFFPLNLNNNGKIFNYRQFIIEVFIGE